MLALPDMRRGQRPEGCRLSGMAIQHKNTSTSSSPNSASKSVKSGTSWTGCSATPTTPNGTAGRAHPRQRHDLTSAPQAKGKEMSQSRHGLAGAVRPGQAERLAGLDPQVKPVH